MKKISLLLAILILFAAILFVSCTTKEDNSSTSSDNANSDDNPKYSGEYLELSAMDLTPYIKLGDYKGVTIEVEKLKHTEEDIDEQIQQIVESNTTQQQITVGEVKKGDTIGIDYEGYMNEALFDGGSSTGAEIVADDEKSGYIPGFADGLIGANIGDTVTLNLTFPESYGKAELAGKDVKFIVKVNYVLGEDIVPEVTDEFVQEVTSGTIETVEALREDIAEWLDENIESDNKLLLYETLMNKCEYISLPQKHVDYYYYQMVDEVTSIAESMSTTYEDFIGSYYHYMYYAYGYISFYFETDAKVKEYAENTTKEELFLFAVAQAENITVSDEEYTEYLNEMVEQYSNQYTAQEIEDGIGKIYIKQLLLSSKVQKFLDENNQFELALEW